MEIVFIVLLVMLSAGACGRKCDSAPKTFTSSLWRAPIGTKLPSWADEVRLRKPTAAESKKSAAHFAELCDIRRRTGASLLEARHILAKQHKGLGCTCSSCLIVGEAQAAARGTAV